MNERFDSERLRMRPQTVADAEALHAGYADVELMTYWSSAPHRSVAETVDYITPRVGDIRWRGWSMVPRGGRDAIGTLAAGERRAGVVEIGYMLVRSHWGQGFAREGVTRLIDRLFLEEGYRRIFADTDPENYASNHLLERLGFRNEGRLREEWETHIGLRDSFIWGLLRHEWRR